MLEEVDQQQNNAKKTFLHQEISRHGGKPRTIKSWLKENKMESKKWVIM